MIDFNALTDRFRAMDIADLAQHETIISDNIRRYELARFEADENLKILHRKAALTALILREKAVGNEVREPKPDFRAGDYVRWENEYGIIKRLRTSLLKNGVEAIIINEETKIVIDCDSLTLIHRRPE